MSSDYVTVDTMSTAAGYVSREFGDYGYSMRVCTAGVMTAVFELRSSDGGRRLFAVDRYGNIELAPDDGSLDWDIGDKNKINAWLEEAVRNLSHTRNDWAAR